MDVETKRIDVNGQTVWEKNNKFSAGVVVTAFVMNLETLNEYQESNTLWFKASTEERLEKMVSAQTKLIEKGAIVAYRVFSETPMYEGQEMDMKINADGSLGEEMDRYSQSNLGLPEKALVMNRTFITVEPIVKKIAIEAEA